jgi:hypothetical protein
MLSVTESAFDHIAGALTGEDPNRVLRLTTTKEGLALVADEPRSGDEIHKHNGKPLLVLDEKISSAVGEQTLDVAVQQGQARLTLR